VGGAEARPVTGHVTSADTGTKAAAPGLDPAARVSQRTVDEEAALLAEALDAD
jgi:hypothetical protein